MTAEPRGGRDRCTGCAASCATSRRSLRCCCWLSSSAAASHSFATLGNLENILTQISVTGIIAVGLTFVILCAEIDLSVASIANATGIVVAYFTVQDASVTSPTSRCRAGRRSCIALALVLRARRGERVRHDA